MKENEKQSMLVGIKEATGIIGIGRNKLIDLIKTSKNAPVIYTGGKYFLIRSEINPWLYKIRGFYKN